MTNDTQLMTQKAINSIVMHRDEWRAIKLAKVLAVKIGFIRITGRFSSIGRKVDE